MKESVTMDWRTGRSGGLYIGGKDSAWQRTRHWRTSFGNYFSSV